MRRIRSDGTGKAVLLTPFSDRSGEIMELSSNSLSISISKKLADEEMSMRRATMEDAASRSTGGIRPEAITNEEINKGDPILNTYKVISDAIHGGMGSVWRVHHGGWNVDLAMKRPQPRFFAEGSDSRKEEFVAECENWINLGLHSGIVSCYYVREIGGVPSIFSEWMDGGSLKDRIRDGSLYEGTEQEVRERILGIAIQTARGLKYSHEQGLIHQDIKPGNILLSKDWDAKVADFGLAKAQRRLRDGEKRHSVGGTQEYCPREQAKGMEAEAWMDLYAFALTVIEMYAGGRSWKTGAEAKEQGAALFASCRVHCPDSLAESLSTWLRNQDNTNVFDKAEQVLLKVYREQTGRNYLDDNTSSADDTSDSLNNYALSYIDLGFPEQAESLLEEAVHRQNDARDPVFNYALLRWRNGEITDAECVAFLQEHLGDGDETVSEIRRERGYEDSLSRITPDPPVSTYNLKSLVKPMAFDIRAAKHGSYLGVLRSRDWSDPNYLFSVFSCDENGFADNEIMQTETLDSSTWFSVIDDTVLVFTDEAVEFYHFGVSEQYHTIYEKGAYWNKHIVEAENSQIIVLTREKDENGSSRKMRYRVDCYENLPKLIEEHEIWRTEIEIADEVDNVFYDAGKLFLIGFDRIIVLDAKMRELMDIPVPSIEQAFLKNHKVYVFAKSTILSLDTATLTKEMIAGGGNYANGRSGVSADGKHVITFEDERLKIYDTNLHRCVADWHEDRFHEWEKVVVIAESADTFTLHVKNRVYDHSSHGYHPEYIHETYRIPVLGEPCTWNLSRIQSYAERMEAEKAFGKLLDEARNALDAGSIPDCLRLLEEGYGTKGFEQNRELRELNETAGKGRDIIGIRYIQKAASAYEPKAEEKPVGLIGTGTVLTHYLAEESGRFEYRLVNWETGEIRYSYSAADSSVFACVSRDGALAAAIENVTQESFTVLTMNLRDGGSERISVPAYAEPDQIHAAADGKRIIIFTGHHCVMIENGSEYRMAAAETQSMAFGCFSPDGKLLAKAGASSYSHGSEPAGQGVMVIRTGKLPEDCERVYSSEMYGFSGVDINNEGIALVETIVLFPDTAGFAVRCSGQDGETKYKASSFTPDGSGFVAVSGDGALTLFKPRSDNDYRIKVLDSDPRKKIVYENPVKMMTLTPLDKIFGASDILTDGRILFNGNGTAFLDAGGGLWVIDYKYSEKEQMPFLRPSYGKTEQTDEYQRELSKLDGADLFIQDDKGKRNGKKGILARLFGWMK